MKPTWMTIEQVAQLTGDEFNNIVEFICDDRIPFSFHSDGVLIWFEGFQMVMPELYDLERHLDHIHEAASKVTESDTAITANLLSGGLKDF